jgi:tRNA-binding protein
MPDTTLSYDDFLKVDLRVGTIVRAEPFPEAKKPAYRLEIDLGPGIGIKRSSAQVTQYHEPEEMVGKQVVCVVNFPEKRIGPYVSQVLTTGVDGEKGVVLLVPERKVENGMRVY